MSNFKKMVALPYINMIDENKINTEKDIKYLLDTIYPFIIKPENVHNLVCVGESFQINLTKFTNENDIYIELIIGSRDDFLRELIFLKHPKGIYESNSWGSASKTIQSMNAGSFKLVRDIIKSYVDDKYDFVNDGWEFNVGAHKNLFFMDIKVNLGDYNE